MLELPCLRSVIEKCFVFLVGVDYLKSLETNHHMQSSYFKCNANQNVRLKARVSAPLQCQNARLETRVSAPLQCQNARFKARVSHHFNAKNARFEARIQHLNDKT